MFSTVLAFLTGGVTKYLVVGLALVILLGWLFWARASLKADLAQAQTELLAVQTAFDASQVALAHLDEAMATQEIALAERELAINEISAERQSLRRRLREAKQNDQAVKDWASTPLPDAVRRLLQ